MNERIQLLDDLGAEFARVTAETERMRSERGARRTAKKLSLGTGLPVRMVALTTGVTVLLASTAYAIPATRSAIDDVAGSFAGWVSGENHDAPGRAVDADDRLPAWFTQNGEARRIAETGGVSLYVRKFESDEGPRLEFGLGQGLGLVMGGTLESWRRRMDQHAAVVLGSALFGPRDPLDEQGRFPLLGVTARGVQRLKLAYAEGPPLVGDAGNGGFVLLADAWRPLRQLVAYDAAGQELERIDVSDLDMRYLCEKEPACPTRHASDGRR